MEQTKKCSFCQKDIDFKATRCPHCQADLRNWINRHPIITVLIVLFVFGTISSSIGSDSQQSTQQISPATTPDSVALAPQNNVVTPMLSLKGLTVIRNSAGIIAQGQVANISNQELKFVEATVVLNDKNGNFLISENNYLDSEVFASGQTTTFKIYFSDDNQQAYLKNSNVTFNGKIGSDSLTKQIQFIDNRSTSTNAIVSKTSPSAPSVPKQATVSNTITPQPLPVTPQAQVSVPTPVPTPAPQAATQNTSTISSETVSQKNAVKSAKSYLDSSAFSHDGLVAQLEYGQFPHADAVYGVDNSGANWNEQALKKAKSYLDSSAFSHDGLIAQLEYSKFSNAEAVYGVDNVGADWNEQAAKKAKSYMEFSAFSRGSLIAQLKYSKFTQAQAEYGANSVGL